MQTPEQNQDSDFMIEKIKERPVNKRKLLRRTLTTASMAVIFGLIAGFYSSLVIAPSLYCLMKNSVDKRKIAKRDGVKKDKPKYAGAKN